MNKEKISSIFVVGCMVLIILGGVWWYFQPEGPRAYVGIRKVDRSGPKKKYVVPSRIAEIDISSGEIIDTFVLSHNVPVVRDIAVDWKRNKLYAVGDPIVGRGGSKWSTTTGIDIYDLDTKGLVDQIEFNTEAANIRRIRFNPGFDYLYVDNPLKKDNRPTGDKSKNTWAINPKSKDVEFTTGGRLSYISFLSPAGYHKYRFWNDYEFQSRDDIEAGKLIFSFKSDKKLLELYGKEKLIKEGGWQPDPEGKYEDEPFTLDYPQMWGKNPIDFYNRETLELIDTVDLKRDGWEVSGGGGGYQETVTKDNKYMVSTVKIRPEGSDGQGTGALKVIDLENYELIHTIPVGENITEVNVEWQ